MTTRFVEHVSVCAIVLAGSIAVAGCSGSEPADEENIATNVQAVSGGHLFDDATFGGNGRRCATCHNEDNAFTMSPELAQDLYDDNPNDPLFRSIDSDDGVGSSYTRLLNHATIRVVLPLPPTARLHDDPTATVAVLNRAIPSIDNVALEPVLMSDGREPNLQSQASGAINAHFQPGSQPSASDLEKIAQYEQKQFSAHAIKVAANGGPDPGLPKGKTAAEKRGRDFFLPGGRCGQCHSGPLLNQTSDQNAVQPPGVRFEFIFAGFPEFLGGAPLADPAEDIRLWDFKCPEGGSFSCDVAPEAFGWVVEDGWVSIPARDPGLGLITGNPDDVFAFKITSLRNISATAPYFHDNSADTLEDVVAHYDLFFTAFEGVGLTPQEQSDIVSYLKLL